MGLLQFIKPQRQHTISASNFGHGGDLGSAVAGLIRMLLSLALKAGFPFGLWHKPRTELLECPAKAAQVALCVCLALCARVWDTQIWIKTTVDARETKQRTLVKCQHYDIPFIQLKGVPLLPGKQLHIAALAITARNNLIMKSFFN